MSLIKFFKISSSRHNNMDFVGDQVVKLWIIKRCPGSIYKRNRTSKIKTIDKKY